MGFKAAFRNSPDEASLDFSAGSHAARTQDTFVQVNENKGIGVLVNGIAWRGRHKRLRVEFIETRPPEEFIIRIVIRVTGIMINAEEQFEHRSAGLCQLLILGDNFHSFRDRGGAGCSQSARSFNTYQAHAASASRGEVFVVAQSWDGDPSVLSCLQDCPTGFCLDIAAVNFQVNHIVFLLRKVF
jgi:hypothetical protein